MKGEFKDIKCVVFDLDGTIHFGKQLALGAREIISACKERFECVLFGTNNSALTRKDLQARLKGFDIEASVDEIINVSYLIAQFLAHKKIKNVHCLGASGLKSEIEALGIDINSQKPEAIVIGYDRNFHLAGLEKAINLYKKGCKVIAANKERVFPRDDGILAPGCGAVVSAFECCVNHKVDEIIGKPNTIMLEFIAKKFGLKNSQILVIGDTLESDIKMAENFGSVGILVGENKPESYKGLYIKALKDLLEMI